MKKLTLFCIIILLFGCGSNAEEFTVNTINAPDFDCAILELALQEDDNTKIKEAIDLFCAQLPEPEPTEFDHIGHLENTQLLVEMLNECSELEATLNCYACAKSIPPQTLIYISVISKIDSINKEVNIYAPEETEMFVAGY